MKKFPLIEKLGLMIYSRDLYFISAQDLESLLAGLPDFWLRYTPAIKTAHYAQPLDATHKAKFLLVEEIKPEVCEHEPDWEFVCLCVNCKKRIEPKGGWEVKDD